MRAAWLLAVCVVAVAPPGVRGAEDPIDKLLVQVKADDARERRLAAEALGKVKGDDKRVLSGLGAALRDSNVSVRQAATSALAGKGAAAVPELTAVLPDGERPARRAAASALRTLGREARAAAPALAKALEDADVEVRIHAAVALQAMGPDAKAAIPALIEAARDLGHVASRFRVSPGCVSLAALDAIARIDPGAMDKAARKSVPGLLRALQGKDASARMWAGDSLARLGPSANSAIPTLVKMAREKDQVFQSLAMVALAQMGAEGQAAMIELLSDTEVSAQTWARSLRELRRVRLPARVVPRLIKFLGDSKAEVRARAVVLLGDVGPDAREAIPALVSLSKDQALLDISSDIKRDDGLVVAAALARIGEPALPALTRALADEDVLTRRQAAHALFLMGRKAKPDRVTLEKAMNDTKATVAVEAAAAVLRLDGRSEKAQDILLQGLQQSASLRLDAIQRIGALGPRMKRAVPALIELLSADSERVKRAALLALRNMKQEARPAVPQMAQELKTADRYFSFYIIDSLADLGPDASPAVPALIDCLKRSDFTVREAAIALGNIGPRAKEAVPALRGLLTKGSFERGEAIVALGKIGPAAAPAVPELLDLLKGKSRYDRAHAARALGEIGAREAIPALEGLLQDEAMMVRAWAAFALARLRGKNAPYLSILEEIYHQRPTESFGTGRSDAVEALIALGPPPEAAGVLSEAAGDESLGAYPRSIAVRALGKLGKLNQSAMPKLIALLQVEKPSYGADEAHEAAAEALGNLGPLARNAVPYLEKLLDDDNETVSQAAAEALKKIEGK